LLSFAGLDSKRSLIASVQQALFDSFSNSVMDQAITRESAGRGSMRRPLKTWHGRLKRDVKVVPHRDQQQLRWSDLFNGTHPPSADACGVQSLGVVS
jgi:hypothetical protein